jgi:hypothetical protein
VVETFGRLLCAIALETLALIVWNIGTRPPDRLLRDVQGAWRNPGALARGVVAFVAGSVLIAAAAVLILPALPDPVDEFAPVEIIMFLAAIVAEHLIGDDVRRAVRRGVARRSPHS